MRLVWSPLALDHVAEIAEEIAADGQQAADGWIDTILSAAERVVRFPHSGRVVPEVRREDIREIVEGSYRIIYRVDSDQVSVLTFRHSRQLTRSQDVRG